MEFVDVDQARGMPGLKLVLTKGIPGPWGQAVKNMFTYKRLPFIPVAQYAAQDNAALVDWIGVRNAPTIVVDPKRPVIRWLDQIMFVETHMPEPALMPRDPTDRAMTFGLCNELAGEWGYGWCRRLMMFAETLAANPDPAFRKDPVMLAMMADYGASDASIAAAPQRCVDILNTLTARLKAQQSTGSSYLVGTSVTAADIYWAAFSLLLEPLSPELCPVPVAIPQYGPIRHPAIVAAKDPVLLQHRDMMFRKHLGPLEY